MSEWCTIESDPGVFTELIKGIGVKNVAVEEIYSLEDEEFVKSLAPIYGLIFLFKWTKDPEKRECLQYFDNDLFFANQVITNACATQAILSILLNCPSIDIGPELANFKSFTSELDPQMRGLALGESDVIKNIHNSFARPEPFMISHDKKSKKEGEAFHFISFVPFKGKLYELDGLQEGPILLGDCNDDNWINVAKEEINKRILKYADTELRFTLLAVVSSKKVQLETEIAEWNNIKGLLYKKYKDLGGILDSENAKEADELISKAQEIPTFQIPTTMEAVLAKLSEANNEIEKNKILLSEEEIKYKKYEEENIRRRHNYLPFIIELLKMTAKKGKLKELVEAAKEKQKARNAQKQKK